MLSASVLPLGTAGRLVMLDLDGVVYRGPHAVPGVAEDLAAVRAAGARVAFVTNNAARSPAQVAAHLRDLGVPAVERDVVTSSQAAAALLRDVVPGRARVLVLGSSALADEVEGVGLRPVLVGSSGWAEEHVQGVVSGFGPDLVWQDILRSAVVIGQGIPWVAANTDLTFPADYGLAPGHGALVRLLSEHTGRTPLVAGKPEAPLLRTAMRRFGAEDAAIPALMVGDRLDTDILAGRRLGVPSLLVMTGVTGLAELQAAQGDERPSFVVDTLAGLQNPQSVPEITGSTARHGPWEAHVHDHRLLVRPGLTAPSPAERDQWWQVVAALSWAHADMVGVIPTVATGLPPSPR